MTNEGISLSGLHDDLDVMAYRTEDFSPILSGCVIEFTNIRSVPPRQMLCKRPERQLYSINTGRTDFENIKEFMYLGTARSEKN